MMRQQTKCTSSIRTYQSTSTSSSMYSYPTSRIYSLTWLRNRIRPSRESTNVFYLMYFYFYIYLTNCVSMQTCLDYCLRGSSMSWMTIRMASLNRKNSFKPCSKFITQILNLNSNLYLICKINLYLLIMIGYRYDFDNDGVISPEDVRLILSYVPIDVSDFYFLIDI